MEMEEKNVGGIKVQIEKGNVIGNKLFKNKFGKFKASQGWKWIQSSGTQRSKRKTRDQYTF